MRRKRAKESQDNIKILIILIFFTAVILIVSTYSWFTTQKDVTIANLKGTIEVAESLEISLDGVDWSHRVDVSDTVLVNSEEVANVNRNIIPNELLPVSSTGEVKSDGLLMSLKKATYNSGAITEITNAIENCDGSDADKSQGYFAFDIYLKNLSKDFTDLGETLYDDAIKLNSNSFAWVLGEDPDDIISKPKNINGTTVNVTYKGDEKHGLQNTLRIAFARYGDGSSHPDKVDQGFIESGESQETIIANNKPGTSNPMTISAVSIWEPNAALHTQSVYNSVKIKTTGGIDNLFSTTNASEVKYKQGTFLKDAVDKMFKTYAIKASVNASAASINPSDWTQSSYFAEQNTVQTLTYYNDDHEYYIINPELATETNNGVTPLTTVSDAATPEAFTLAPNSVTKVRVYVWMEGQDPDCTIAVTQGRGIELQIGLVKSIEDGDIEKRNEDIRGVPASE